MMNTVNLTFGNILQELIGYLVSGITGIASGLGTGITALVKAFFVSGTGAENDPYTLTVFGALVAIFGGISLAVGISRLIFNWVSSLGATN